MSTLTTFDIPGLYEVDFDVEVEPEVEVLMLLVLQGGITRLFARSIDLWHKVPKMQTTSKRGRPQEADPHEISRVALQLFERNGFDQVTMGEIAEAASVSRRTLFRLFPSKSDLVWGGLSEVRDILQERVAVVVAREVQLGVVFRELVEPFLLPLDEPEAAQLARRRLRLIAEVPALFNHPTLREIEGLIAMAVAGAALPRDAPPGLVARSLFAASFAALLWWAEHGEGVSALVAIRAAFRSVALAQVPE